MTYNSELSECIFILYNNSEEFKEFSEILTKVHLDNNKIFSQYVYIKLT